MRHMKASVSFGYRKVTVNGKSQFVHRLIAEAFVGLPVGKDVNHLNFCRSFNFATNLKLCSHSENIKYSIKRGRFSKSEKFRNYLNETQVSEIKKLVKIKKKKDVARMFNVKPWTISKILSGVSYGST
jgi:hypothetical protein